MNTWTERISKGEAWEALVLRKLNESGYQAKRYGQGLISELSTGLQAANSALRHDPDLILWNDNPRSPESIFGVDCKYGRTDTGQHAVQDDSITGLHAWQVYSGLYVFLAFNHPFDRIGIMPLAQYDELKRPGRRSPNGSGNPYTTAVCRCTFPTGLIQPTEGELRAIVEGVTV
jgi:hypothetical protein